MTGFPFYAGMLLAAIEDPTHSGIGWFTYIIQTVLVGGGCFAIAAALVSHMRYRRILEEAREQLKTGGDRDAFALAVSERLGFMGRNTRPFGLLLMQNRVTADLDEEMQQMIREAVSGQLRKEDVLIHLRDGRLGLLVETERDNLTPIASRIRAGLKKQVFRLDERRTLRPDIAIAMVSFPENGEDADSLLQALDTAMPRALEGDGWALAHSSADAELSSEEPTVDPGQNHLLDELTGVLKAARVGSAIQKYIARFRRDEEPVSVIVCDVDGLDQYNNHYGRDAGDAILHLTARILMSHCRETDLIGRPGEDQFMICMPCRVEEAVKAARRMTAEIKKATLEHGGNRLRFTVCMGTAGFPEHGGSPVRLYDRAVYAMEAAKERGRSLCIAFEKELDPALQPRKQGSDVF